MNKLSRATVIGFVITAVILFLAAVGYFLLPDMLIAQIGFDGQPQTWLPKPLLLAIPVGISVLGVGISFMEGKRASGVIVPAIALAVFIFVFCINR